MTNIDNIFKESNMPESKKLGQMIFGKVLIQLRKNNFIKLYSLLECVTDTEFADSVLELELSDKISYDMLNNATDLNTLERILGEVESGAKLKLKCSAKTSLDLVKFESFLKSEFGRILTIK